MKRNSYSQKYSQPYFWRTKTQQEVDYIEEADGKLSAFEFKWNPKKANVKVPQSLIEAYPGSDFMVVTPDNVEEFIGKK